MQCRAHGSTFEFLFEFQTEFFSNFLFEFQVVRESNRSTIKGPLYIYILYCQTAELYNVKPGSTYSHHCALKY